MTEDPLTNPFTDEPRATVVAVVGQGYVGLPVAMPAVEVG